MRAACRHRGTAPLCMERLVQKYVLHERRPAEERLEHELLMIGIMARGFFLVYSSDEARSAGGRRGARP